VTPYNLGNFNGDEKSLEFATALWHIPVPGHWLSVPAGKSEAIFAAVLRWLGFRNSLGPVFLVALYWSLMAGGFNMFQPTPLKNMSQLGLLFPIYGKIFKKCLKPPTRWLIWVNKKIIH
jgi:hypothetical protein